MNTAPRSRLDAWLPTLLLLAGSIAFLVGGRSHPRVNAMTMPASGTPEYYRHFAEMMLAMPDWELVHTLILTGPVLWALGAAGAARVLPVRASVLTDIARAALLGGAVLWALAFVLDGYVGPRHARAIAAAGPASDAGALATFGTNAFTMARIGMISIALIATSVLGFASALLIEARPRSWRVFVGVAGLLVGAWPLVATLQGRFHPGPFTSVHWTATAISLGLWFLLLATTLPALPNVPRAGSGR